MATKAKNYRRFKNYLDKNGFDYKKDDAKKELRMVVPLSDNENSIIIQISCDDFFVEVNACFEHFADESVRKEVMEYLMRINYRLKNGCFVINLDDGEISLRSNLNCFERDSLSDDLIGLTIAGPRFMYNYYYKGLLDVMSDKKSPEKAVFEISVRDTESCSCGCDH